jgi:hypothetical protein
MTDLEKVKNNGYDIIFIKDENLTQQMCDIAIATSPEILALIPERFQTTTMCWSCITSKPTTIRFVQNQSEEMMEYCLSIDESLFYHFKNPPEFISIKSVSQLPSLLKYINKSKQTEDIVISALRKDVSSAIYIKMDITPKIKTELVLLSI